MVSREKPWHLIEMLGFFWQAHQLASGNATPRARDITWNSQSFTGCYGTWPWKIIEIVTFPKQTCYFVQFFVNVYQRIRDQTSDNSTAFSFGCWGRLLVVMDVVGHGMRVSQFKMDQFRSEILTTDIHGRIYPLVFKHSY